MHLLIWKPLTLQDISSSLKYLPSAWLFSTYTQYLILTFSSVGWLPAMYWPQSTEWARRDDEQSESVVTRLKLTRLKVQIKGGLLLKIFEETLLNTKKCCAQFNVLENNSGFQTHSTVNRYMCPLPLPQQQSGWMSFALCPEGEPALGCVSNCGAKWWDLRFLHWDYLSPIRIPS